MRGVEKKPWVILVVWLVTAPCLVVSCEGETGEETGSSRFVVDNQSDEELRYEYTVSIHTPEVLSETIAPTGSTEILHSYGGFGAWDRPQEVFASFRVLRTDDAVVRAFDPVAEADWELVQVVDYNARYRLTVTQEEVDAAVVPLED